MTIHYEAEGFTYKIYFEGNEWIRVKYDGVDWMIVGCNVTEKSGNWISDSTALAFNALDDEVIDLDDGTSDESQCFGISNKLKYKDVTITPECITAKSFEELLEALAHVTPIAWCPGDI